MFVCLCDLNLDGIDCSLDSDETCSSYTKCLTPVDWSEAGEFVRLARLEDGIDDYCRKGKMTEPIVPNPKDDDDASLLKGYHFLGGYDSDDDDDDAPSYCKDLFTGKMNDLAHLACVSSLQTIVRTCPSGGGVTMHDCGTFSLYSCPPGQFCKKTN